jgi:putative ABC transport system permease protein
MRWNDHLRGLRHTFAIDRGRAALTLLGIVIGTGSIVMLAGLLEGAEEALVKMNQGINDSDTLRIDKDEPPQHQLDKAQRPLSRADAEALAGSPQMQGVEVAIESRKETRAYWQGRQKRVRLVGGEPRSFDLFRITVERGRALDRHDVREGRRVAVIGHEIWRELLEKDPDVLGKQLRVDEHNFTIVGILAHKPSMGHGTGTWMWDRKILIPQTAYDAVLTPSHDINSIFLRAQRASPSEKWMNTLGLVAEKVLLRRHFGVKNFEVGDRKGDQQERLIITIIQILLVGTGLMSLFVGGINIMNIMLVTVTERTREIGIRRAIGANPRAIWIQFLLEATAISMTGGLAGVAGGVLVSWLITLGLAQAFGEWSFHVEPWSIVLGLALALITGIAFGMFPAWRASRLNPVEALRHE